MYYQPMPDNHDVYINFNIIIDIAIIYIFLFIYNTFVVLIDVMNFEYAILELI